MSIGRPDTRYALSGGLNIAYQVVGSGPVDLLYVPGWVSHVELGWELPQLVSGFERLSSFSRLILFDKRGTGMSDSMPTGEPPTLEQRMDDVRAVMDAVGSERAAVFGASEGGSMSMLFAATYPARTVALCTFGGFAKRLRTPDYPWAPSWDQRVETYDQVERYWTTGIGWDDLAPSLDPAGLSELSRYFRRCASPGAALALTKMNTHVDVRDVLPTIRVRTVVMHRTDDRDANVEEGRYIAAQIPGARFVEFPGADHTWWTPDRDAILDEIAELVTGVRPVPQSNRVLATVVFTDIVGSTARIGELGDRDWSELLARHHAAVRRELERSRGREVNTAGDGSSPPSTVRPGRSARRFTPSGSTSGPACTPASASRSARVSTGSPSTPERGYPHSRDRARCSSQRRCEILSRARASCSRIAGNTNSRASAGAESTPSSRPDRALRTIERRLLVKHTATKVPVRPQRAQRPSGLRRRTRG
jgi:pimeloyl-ACP methyl ester carboxylesterase